MFKGYINFMQQQYSSLFPRGEEGGESAHTGSTDAPKLLCTHTSHCMKHTHQKVHESILHGIRIGLNLPWNVGCGYGCMVQRRG